MIEAKLISTWDELAQVPDSETHYLEIGKYNGWVKAKEPKSDKFSDRADYLSTHTFYGLNHEHSTKLLQERGFNVVIANWDNEE